MFLKQQQISRSTVHPQHILSDAVSVQADAIGHMPLLKHSSKRKKNVALWCFVCYQPEKGKKSLSPPASPTNLA